MRIPETQLETWCNQGATTIASTTYTSVRAALTANTSPVAGLISSGAADVYLQGSYKNTTNIRGDSDVDIIVQLDTTFNRDLSALSAPEVVLYNQTHRDSDYHVSHFRRDVLAALRAHYTAGSVTEGNKSLKVAGASGRLPSDVVPALLYKKYQYYRSLVDEGFIPGIRFDDRSGRTIYNYPKLHYENGVAKNAVTRTAGNYKASVRMFKNARTYMTDLGMITDSLAPSYFLESLIYNVPDGTFGPSRQGTYSHAVNWLSDLSAASLTGFVCQNEQLPLFGNTAEQWSVGSAQTLIAAFADLWNNW